MGIVSTVPVTSLMRWDHPACTYHLVGSAIALCELVCYGYVAAAACGDMVVNEAKYVTVQTFNAQQRLALTIMTDPLSQLRNPSNSWV